MNVDQKSVDCNTNLDYADFDTFIAIDWSTDGCGFATMKSNQGAPRKRLIRARIRVLREELIKLPGKCILAIEETTSTHWLFCELRDCVDEILICDPYRNHLLKEGPKTDKIDAGKLCLLLRSGMLKPVYHTGDALFELRKVSSTYHQMVQSTTRLKNQRAAFLRSFGQPKRGSLPQKARNPLMSFIAEQQATQIDAMKPIKYNYLQKFRELSKQHPVIRRMQQVSGIGQIWAVTIYGIVIEANRFKSKYKYWSYCGLASDIRQSGKQLSWRKTRYNHLLKNVYKSAAIAATRGKNDIREYYDHLLRMGYSTEKARNAAARYIAKVTWAMMKNNSNYKPYEWRSH